ncbi:proton-conducting transporter transmembrane domain-containing protein [Actinokineospora sp. HUAS TT18]|uniref:proton-conducting transporter transmembrane domain-containing protein n=1 Tax=Actinokineospora sp. HUAS TT18 TaxID=3447451 RepID=UPI003F5287BA
MSLASVCFASAVGLGAATAAAGSVGARGPVVGAGVALTGAAGAVAGVAATLGDGFMAALPLLPLSGLAFTLDALGGVFVAVTGGVAVAAGVYGMAESRGRVVAAALPLFVVAMLLVPAASSVATLLVCWELMAVTSLPLVFARHRESAAVASAGRWYTVMTQLGFACVLGGLLLLAAHAGNDFAAIRAPAVDPAIATVVFLLILAGFGSKAGMVPLHVWLPRAHPEAPSHVSALMSAAMVNLGVYGVVRVGVDLLDGGQAWWWLLVLALGALSAVYGILQAAMSTDLKRLLGLSTVENLGLVFVGVGASGMFAASGQDVLAGVALTAALLHVAAHAAFKTLLFLAAGSVLHATGTRDLDELGGLRRSMPVTTAAFGLGALAASALPPGTAFVSEWLLLQALVHGLPASSTAAAVALPVAVAAIALTAGLAVATFVKAFGIGFLAKPRTTAAEHAEDSPPAVLAGMAVAGVACVALAVAPTLVLPGLVAAAGSGSVVADGALLRLSGITGALAPLGLAVAVVAVVVVAAAGVRVVAGRGQRSARLWDGGGGPMSARMEYTATSFAEPLQRVFDDVVRPELDIDVTHHDESRYLVDAVEYRRRVPDRIERRLYAPVITAATAWGKAARGLANGSVHRYLGYGFYTVCALLVVLAVIR